MLDAERLTMPRQKAFCESGGPGQQNVRRNTAAVDVVVARHLWPRVRMGAIRSSRCECGLDQGRRTMLRSCFTALELGCARRATSCP